MQKPVIIWDIDGTLSDSSGAGIHALSQAISTFFGQPAPKLNLAGATDSGIYQKMCSLFDREYEASGREEFFATYLPILEATLKLEQYQGKVYDTVVDTLEFFQDNGYAQGLLTGNVERGAYLKNDNCGIASYFAFGAYGCDHHDRNALGPVAAQRASQHLGYEVHPQDLLIVGDTLKDIACARACGAKVAAVTTGFADRASLQEADWVIDHASELKDIVSTWAE